MNGLRKLARKREVSYQLQPVFWLRVNITKKYEFVIFLQFSYLKIVPFWFIFSVEGEVYWSGPYQTVALVTLSTTRFLKRSCDEKDFVCGLRICSVCER